MAGPDICLIKRFACRSKLNENDDNGDAVEVDSIDCFKISNILQDHVHIQSVVGRGMPASQPASQPLSRPLNFNTKPHSSQNKLETKLIPMLNYSSGVTAIVMNVLSLH
ncbi:hypothetical protein WN944_017202 [Citrus x changshan-huyou]|uniref:Uncharacterized protein n=1 Tax=Citrus x changshan-huyou TaxID=2935761 RepID=A0AAP0QL08_9ROSI